MTPCLPVYYPWDNWRTRLRLAFPLLFRRPDPPLQHKQIVTIRVPETSGGIPDFRHVRDASEITYYTDCPFDIDSLPETALGSYPPPLFPFQEAFVERRNRNGRLIHTLHLRAFEIDGQLTWRMVSLTEDPTWKSGSWIPFPA